MPCNSPVEHKACRVYALLTVAALLKACMSLCQQDHTSAGSQHTVVQAEARRQFSAEKKRATKLETSLKKVTNLYESRLTDVKALKTALANKDEQLKVRIHHMTPP